MPSDEALGFVQFVGPLSPKTGPIPQVTPTSKDRPSSPAKAKPTSPAPFIPLSHRPTSSLQFKPILPNSLRPALSPPKKPVMPIAIVTHQPSSRPSSPSDRAPPTTALGQLSFGTFSAKSMAQPPTSTMPFNPLCVEQPFSPALPAGSPISSISTSPPSSRQLASPHRPPFSPESFASFTSLLRYQTVFFC